MDVSRRSFLQSIIAASAVMAMPSIAMPKLPLLHGDGVSDDTPAIQAFINGEPFIFGGEVRQRKTDEAVYFPRGIFRVSAPITFLP